MIPKNNRVYIDDWFDDKVELKEGDTVIFEMPPFCSGDYKAKVFVDNDGDSYIDKKENYYKGCRDFYIKPNPELF